MVARLPTPTFDPARKLFFVTAHETCADLGTEETAERIELGVRVPAAAGS